MQANDPLPCVELEPGRPATHAVLWLHGLGADGHDFEPIVPELGLGAAAVRFVFPHAPVIPVTLNGGMPMRAWYDIRSLDADGRADEAGVRRSAARIEQLIAREKARGIPAERVFLAGFSQGGAIALHVALRHAERLAGLVVLSAYLVCAAALEDERSDANRQLPVFQAHGTHDPLVTLAMGEAAHERLVALGHPVEWSTYPMQHQVCAEEIEALGRWLGAAL